MDIRMDIHVELSVLRTARPGMMSLLLTDSLLKRARRQLSIDKDIDEPMFKTTQNRVLSFIF